MRNEFQIAKSFRKCLCEHHLPTMPLQKLSARLINSRCLLRPQRSRRALAAAQKIILCRLADVEVAHNLVAGKKLDEVFFFNKELAI